MTAHPKPAARWLPWLCLIPLAVLTGLWAVPRLLDHRVQAGEEEPPGPAPVRLAAADIAVVRAQRVPLVAEVSGVVEALPNGRAVVSAEVAGRLMGFMLKPGDRVTAGQVLGQVRRSDLDANVQQAGAAVAEARRQVAGLEAQLQAQTASLDAQERTAGAARAEAQAKLDRLRAGSRPEEIERAQAQLEAAQADLLRLRNGPRPQELRQAESAVRQAAAEVDVTQRSATRLAALVDKGVAAARDLERAQADMAQARERQSAAAETLNLLRAGTRPEEIRAQEARVHDAQVALKLLKLGPRPEEIREAEAWLAQAVGKLDEAAAQRRLAQVTREQIAAAREHVSQAEAARRSAAAVGQQTLVRAPVGGVVNRVMAATGETVQPGAALAEVESSEGLRLLLQVPMSYQSVLKPGLAVVAFLPHQPGQEWSTRLRVVNPRINPESGTLTAEAWLPNTDRRLRAGLIVNARLELEAGKIATTVPPGAVFAIEGEQFVYRLEADGTLRAVKITPGREEADRVQVLSGLRPGDRILHDGNRSLVDGTPFKL